jgi:hypothetical protein
MAMVQLRCLQSNCKYAPKAQPLAYRQTGKCNYWTHYDHSHPAAAATTRQLSARQHQSSSQGSSHTASVVSLFTPRTPTTRNLADKAKFRSYS